LEEVDYGIVRLIESIECDFNAYGKIWFPSTYDEYVEILLRLKRDL